jgi:uncharacterized cupin superfamily protein
MPKIDIANVPARTSTVYPAEFRDIVKGREKQPLGNAVGLTQFGVNLTRLKPGAASALRHWHQSEDELIYMLEGELVLIENEGETVMRPGDAAGFKAGVTNGHHLINRSAGDAVYLEIGARSVRDHVEYPDVDLLYDKDGDDLRLTHKSGEPYPRTER